MVGDGCIGAMIINETILTRIMQNGCLVPLSWSGEEVRQFIPYLVMFDQNRDRCSMKV